MKKLLILPILAAVLVAPTLASNGANEVESGDIAFYDDLRCQTDPHPFCITPKENDFAYIELDPLA